MDLRRPKPISNIWGQFASGLPPYPTNSDFSDMSAANAQLTSQLATATSLAIGGVVLGIIGIAIAILAMRKRPAKTT